MLLEERRYAPDPSSRGRPTPSPTSTSATGRSSGRPRAANRVTWFEPFSKLYEWEPPYAKWYLGGKLNVCFNCVDRHVEAGNGDKVAYYWEGEPEDERRTLTFADLQREVVRFANALKKLGVKKGTPVAIYMGMVPELPIAMLACARLGAPHTVVFGGFSAESLSDRMNDMECELLITQDEGWRARQEGAAQAERRRGRGAGTDRRLLRAAAHRRRRSVRRVTRLLVARAHGETGRRSGLGAARADGRGGSALSPLHVGDDREAEGDRADPPHRLGRRRGRIVVLSLRELVPPGVA